MSNQAGCESYEAGFMGQGGYNYEAAEMVMTCDDHKRPDGKENKMTLMIRRDRYSQVFCVSCLFKL